HGRGGRWAAWAFRAACRRSACRRPARPDGSAAARPRGAARASAPCRAAAGIARCDRRRCRAESATAVSAPPEGTSDRAESGGAVEQVYLARPDGNDLLTFALQVGSDEGQLLGLDRVAVLDRVQRLAGFEVALEHRVRAAGRGGALVFQFPAVAGQVLTVQRQ